MTAVIQHPDWCQVEHPAARISTEGHAALVGTCTGNSLDIAYHHASVYAVIYRDGRRRIVLKPYGTTVNPEEAETAAALTEGFENGELAAFIHAAAELLARNAA